MFLREEIRECAACQELTPHSRRAVSLPLCIAIALVLTAAWCALTGWSYGIALLSVVLALVVFNRDRERCLHVACERCRAYALLRWRRKRPTLDGNTEILFALVLSLAIGAVAGGCSSGTENSEHASGERSEMRGEHDRDGTEHGGEHAGEHGGEGRGEHGGEGEESGTELALNQPYDAVRNGARA